VFGEVRREVGFVQDDCRSGAALPGQDQVAFEAAQVEIEVEAGHQQHGVDVGRYDLLGERLAGHLAREAGSTRQDRLDGGGLIRPTRLDGDPVADRRAGGRAGVVVAESAGETRCELAAGGVESIAGAVAGGNASGEQALLVEWLEALSLTAAPAKWGQGSLKLVT
jgi:hypothetical protein